jgi:hypothetical protein
VSCRNPIFDAVADLTGEQAFEAEASLRGDLVAAVSDLVDKFGAAETSWALGVVEGDLAEAAAGLEIESRQAACDAAGGAP